MGLDCLRSNVTAVLTLLRVSALVLLAQPAIWGQSATPADQPSAPTVESEQAPSPNQPAQQDAAGSGPVPGPATKAVKRGYRIGAGDVLQVSVWREPDASVERAAVRSDGKISLPLIKEVDVVDLTPAELEELLQHRFSGYINDPEVTVIVTEIHSEKAYVVGGVVSQGSIELTTPMTVLQVLAEAGGLTEFAKRKKIYVLRERGGRQKQLPFDYDAVLRGKHPEQNVTVRPGDTIIVPE